MAKVTAFHNPRGMVDYSPIPFRDIAFVGEGLRKQSNDALGMAAQMSNLNDQVLSQDETLRNQIYDEYEGQINEVYDLHKEDPRSALDKATKLGMTMNKERTRGRIAQMVQNRASAMQNFQDIDKLYKDNKLSAQDAELAKSFAMNRYKGIGEANEFGQYSNYDPYNAAFIEKSFANQADDFIKGWKSDKYPLGLSKTKYGYINNQTKEMVDPNEVYEQIQGHLKSQPLNMAYAQQQADFATMGMNPNEIITLGNGQEISVNDYKELLKDNYFAQAARPSAEKAGFSQIDRNLSKDWMFAQDRQHAIDNPVIPDYHVRLGTGEVEDVNELLPEGLKNLEFDNFGNPNISSKWGLAKPPKREAFGKGKEAEERYENAMSVYNQTVNKAKIEQGRAIYNKAQELGVKIRQADGETPRTPKEVYEEITNAYKDSASRESTARVIRDPKAAKELGNVLANTLGSSTFFITQPGTGMVINPDGDFDKVAKELQDDWGWTGSDSPTKTMNAIEEQLRTHGQSGWYNGLPYVEVTSENGDKRMVIMSGAKEVEQHTDMANKLLTARSKQEYTEVYDDRTGIIYMYKPTIKNGKFEDKVHAVVPKNGVIPPGNPLNMDPETIQQYYDPSGSTVTDFDEVLRITENVIKNANQQPVRKVSTYDKSSQ